MQAGRRRAIHWLWLFATALILAEQGGTAWGQEIKVALSGSQEIPPVTTQASGAGIISVGADKSVRDSVTISGMAATAVHIHEAAAGTNGPISIPLVKTADNVWSVPEGAELTEAQYESYKSGNLYYNAHSAAYKGGEIRGQIKP